MSLHPVGRVGRDPNIAAGVIDIDDPDLTDLHFAVLAHIRHALADIDQVGCRVERQGSNMIVRLSGPAISEMRRQALAVRVLDAVRSVGRTYGHVDVVYENVSDDRDR